MDVKTEDGIKVLVLPDTARCIITEKNPLYMSDCPLAKEYCCGNCECYTEEEDEVSGRS